MTMNLQHPYTLIVVVGNLHLLQNCLSTGSNSVTMCFNICMVS